MSEQVHALTELLNWIHGTRTLNQVAGWAEKHGRIRVEIVEGSRMIPNGRTERALTVLGIMNEQVCVEQGTTADKVYLATDVAEDIVVARV